MDFVFIRNLVKRCAHASLFPDFKNLLFAEFTRPMLHTSCAFFWMGFSPVFFCTWHPSFVCCVLAVFSRSSKKQVVWSNTGRVIAFMKNPQALRNFSDVEPPRNSVSTTIHFTSTRKLASSVSKLLLAGCPNPALSKLWTMFRNWTIFVYSFQKSFLKELSVAWHKPKNHRLAKALWAHLWPQLPDGGKNGLSSSAFSDYNGAVGKLAQAPSVAI